ncbi:polysaccharide deacetylase family protein [Clostridium sp.]|uniref:polysaccharide deacetylase family protein n=1 Tax=Clostridium sp. TaxID=1506 RepID=UPI003BB1AF8D
MFKGKKVVIEVILLVLVIILSVIVNKRSISVSINETAKLPIFRVNTEEKEVALTFDINWAEEDHLDEILQILKKYDAKGTFFIMGGWVNYTDDNKEKLKNIYNDGHEIGNHSYIHPNFMNITEERMNDELKKTEDIIYQTIGCNTKLFRFPSGSYNEKALNYVMSKGYKCIQWDVDSVDWKQAGADVEYNRVMKNVKEGSILLFHNNAKYTPENLDRIINKLTDEGYKFLTVSELIYDDNYYIDENGVQNKK